MGQKKQFQIGQQQRKRRRLRLKKLRAKSQNIQEFFCDGKYIGPSKEK